MALRVSERPVRALGLLLRALAEVRWLLKAAWRTQIYSIVQRAFGAPGAQKSLALALGVGE